MAAGDVTDALVDELGIRLNDPEEMKFTEAVKLVALNDAILRTCILLNRGYLGELETVDAPQAMTASKLALSALTSGTPFTGNEGVVAVQNATTAGVYMTRVKLEDLKRLENSLLTSGATNMVYYVYAGSIYALNGGAATDPLVVYYLKNPVTLTTSVDPDINAALLDIVVDIAESSLWSTDDTLDRAEDAMASAMLQIDFLNTNYVPPFGIGTEGDNRYKKQA
jgi:hypothetical protein